MWVAGVSGSALDYPGSLFPASCGFVFKRLIQCLPPVGSTFEDLKDLEVSSDLFLSDQCIQKRSCAFQDSWPSISGPVARASRTHFDTDAVLLEAWKLL